MGKQFRQRGYDKKKLSSSLQLAQLADDGLVRSQKNKTEYPSKIMGLEVPKERKQAGRGGTVHFGRWSQTPHGLRTAGSE